MDYTLDVQVNVTIKRTVKAEQKVLMVPSYGFLGIEQARAVIMEIVPDKYSKLSKYSECIEQFRYEGEFSANTIWVAYKYIEGAEEDVVYALPLDIFVEHSITANY